MAKMTRQTDVDGKLAWVIAIGGSMIFFITGGFVRGFGVIFVAIVEEFGTSASMTSLLAGTRAAFMTISAPLGTALAIRFSERKVVVVAGILSFCSFSLTYFATGLPYLVVTLGVLLGITNGLTIPQTQIVIGKYFNKRRAFALGISMCGGSLGQLAAPPIMTLLIKEYLLRGALLIYGAFSLHIVVSGLLMRPMRETIVTELYNEIEVGTSSDAAAKRLYRSLGELDKIKPQIVKENGYYSKSNDQMERTLSQRSDDISLDPNRRVTENLSHIPEVASSPNAKKTPSCCRKAIKTPLKLLAKVICFELFKNPIFCLIFFAVFLNHISFTNQTIFLVPRAKSIGISKETAALLLTILGACDIIGRLCFSFLADSKFIQTYQIQVVAIAIAGIASSLLPQTSNFAAMAAYSAVFGFFGSAGHVLILPNVVDFLGKDIMPRATGMTVFAMALAGAVSPVGFGYAKDVTGKFDVIFYATAAFSFAASVLLCLLPIVRVFREKRHTDNKGESGNDPPSTHNEDATILGRHLQLLSTDQHFCSSTHSLQF